MTRYIVKRILQIIPVLIAVTLLIFWLLSLTPGDPARIALGADATEEQVALFREQHGLNDPVLMQYIHYMSNALKGDFGVSYALNVPVSSLISSRIGNTLILVAGFMILTLLMSIPLGVAMAIKQNSLFDNVMRVFTLLFNSMPQFWLALIMILCFSVKLGWLPASGLDSFSAMIMPTFCLALTALTLLSRSERSAMLEVIHQDYIRTAKSKGLSRGTIIRKHALRNSLLPILTLYGSSVGTCLGGSIVIESVFGISGIGKLTRDSLLAKDTPTIMASVMITALGIAIINLLTDLAYGMVDPRIRSMYKKKKSNVRQTKELMKAQEKAMKAQQAKAENDTDSSIKEEQNNDFLLEMEEEIQTGMKQIESKTKKRSLWGDVWIRLKKNKTAVIGIIVFALIVILCVGSTLVLDYKEDVVSIDVIHRLQGPSRGHPLGTDELGRDLLARILWGGNTSIMAGIISLAVGFLIGGIFGTIAAYYGGTTDSIIMRCMDVFMAIPSILLMITLATIMAPNTRNLILSIGISLVPRQARIVRAQVLQVRDMEYIEAAKIQGASDLKIILSHILPNALAPVITTVILDIGYAITMISTLSYLGLGIQAPAPEWGSMLSASQIYMRDAWYLTTFPGLALMITVVSLTLVGDGLRDALDPRMKR